MTLIVSPLSPTIGEISTPASPARPAPMAQFADAIPLGDHPRLAGTMSFVATAVVARPKRVRR